MSKLNSGSNVDIVGGKISFDKKRKLQEADLTIIPQELRDMEISVGIVTYKELEDGTVARIDEKGNEIGKMSAQKANEILEKRKLKTKQKAAGMSRD